MSQIRSPMTADLPLPEAVGYVHLNYQSHSLARLEKLSGWAFFQNTRYELQNIDELPTDHVWLSNLEWVEHQALVASTRPHVKSNRFLPLTLDQIRHELALEDEDDESFARILVTLGDNLLRLCVEAYKEQFLHHLRYQPTFAHTIAATIGMDKKEQPNIKDELHTSIIWDNVYEQTFLKAPDPSLPNVCFRMPMYRHAENLMQCPLPAENQPWQEVSVPASQLDEFFAHDELPSIVEVTEFKIPSQLDGVYPVNNNSRLKRKNFWLPSIEAAFLRKIGHLEVGRVFVQPGGYRTDTPWNTTVPSVKGCLQLSYSTQMMCHAHFLSAATAIDDAYWPMHAWWIRSMDRQLMMFPVMAITAIEDVTVTSYGEGCVFLQGTPDAISRVIEMAPRLGLTPTRSAWKAGDQKMNNSIRQNNLWLDDNYTVYEKTAIHLSNREIGLTLALDEAALIALSSEQMANEALKQIMLGVSSGKTF